MTRASKKKKQGLGTSNSGSESSDHSVPHSRTPYFFPPLVLQRRTFCVEVLKKEGIKSILELGCGEGSLLGLLARPASHLDDFPPIIPLPPISLSASPNISDPLSSNSSSLSQSLASEKVLVATKLSSEEATSGLVQNLASEFGATDEVSDIADEAELYHLLRRVPAPVLYEKQLHLQKICGLDILEDRLKLAALCTAPPSPEEVGRMFGPAARWEPLTIELWLGSLIHFNENFKDMECIIMSEVIEHLSSEVFDKFIPIVFAAYSPRVIVITTPNYDFNRYFDPVGSQSAGHRFPDPTGRTSRVFRDDDHKFEWTEAEFKEWCQQISQQYDFEVEITGCGSYVNYFGGYSMDASRQVLSHNHDRSGQDSRRVPPPANPDRFFATQCAIFRKRYPNEAERQPRSLKRSELIFHPPLQLVDCPRIFQTYVHPVSPCAARPARPFTILNEVRDVFRNSSRTSIDLRELWFSYPHIAELSGGQVIVLVSALVKVKCEWYLKVDESRRGLDSVVVDWKLPVSLASEATTYELDNLVPLSPSPEPTDDGDSSDASGADQSELVHKIANLGVWDSLEEDQDPKPMAFISDAW